MEKKHGTKKPKVNTKDWANLPKELWNATTVREYIKDLNVKGLGIPCISNNVRVENAMISKFIKDYGIETTVRFVKRCVDSYKPNPNYPTVNFTTMYSYMKQWELPRVMKAQLQESRLAEIKAKQVQKVSNVEEYF